MKPLIMLVILILAIAAFVLGFAWSGLYNVAATSQHTPLAAWLLTTSSRQSIERQARAVAVPDLEDDNLVLAGINDFEDMCAGCHGAPGRKPDAVGRGLMPPPPDLAESAIELSPAELFWATKHGIRMTGMPAWGISHGDDEIWPVVSFLLRLPELDEAGYRRLLDRAHGHGHHASPAPAGPGEEDQGHDHHDHSH